MCRASAEPPESRGKADSGLPERFTGGKETVRVEIFQRVSTGAESAGHAASAYGVQFAIKTR